MADETKQQYDLYVAYADTDRNWVQNHLLRRLGLPAERIITKQDFELGRPTISEFVRAVTASRYTVLVLSRAYLDDELASFSGDLSAYLSIVTAQQNRLIPLRLHPCDLPTDIAFRVSLDCTDEDNWEVEISRLRKLLANPENHSPPGSELGEKLELPTGAVPLESPFYIRRDVDTVLEAQLRRKGTITTIRGARQTGKTSLLLRAIEYAKNQGALVLHLDFQGIFSSSDLSDLNEFLEHLAYLFADQAEIHPADIETIWATPLASKYKLTRLVENLILGKKDNTRVLLAIDEADMLLETQFYSEFFGLLRSWYNRRVSRNQWNKLNIVIMISNHPSLLIADLSQSPFNVGLTTELQDLSEAQVRELNDRHGAPLQPTEIPQAMELLGGQPYLIRQALYTLVTENMTWSELSGIADRENGPFGGHLRYYLNLLYEDVDLMNAARTVVKDQKCPDPRQLLRLSSACLIQEEGGKCMCRYGLYKRFFGRRLL